MQKGKRAKERKVNYAVVIADIILLLYLVLVCIMFTNYIVKEVKDIREKETNSIQSVEPVLKNNEVKEVSVKSLEDEVKEFEEVQEKSEDITYIEFKVTAYCSCEKCCGVWATKRGDGPVYGAAGKELVPNYSVAVDRDLYEFGTIFVDENGNEYEAADVGGAIKGNHLDLYMSDHQEALNWGVRTLKMCVKK